MSYICPNCLGTHGAHSGMDQCPPDPCTCIQDEYRTWLECPVHASKHQQYNAKDVMRMQEPPVVEPEEEANENDFDWVEFGHGDMTIRATYWRDNVRYWISDGFVGLDLDNEHFTQLRELFVELEKDLAEEEANG